MNQGVLIFVVNGFAKEWPLFWHYIFIWLSITTGAMTFLIVFIEFFFRYMIICKSVSFTTWQLTLLGLVLYILSGLMSSLAILALLDTTDQVATFGHLMKDQIWFDEYGKQTIFSGATRTSWYCLLLMACVGLYNVISSGIIFWLGIATFRKLRQSQHTMSAHTKSLNTQMNKVLVLEASFAFLMMHVPIGGLMLTLLFDINVVGLGIIMTMLLAWIPVSNPIMTILLVSPYRRAIFGWMQRFIGKERVQDIQQKSSQT